MSSSQSSRSAQAKMCSYSTNTAQNGLKLTKLQGKVNNKVAKRSNLGLLFAHGLGLTRGCEIKRKVKNELRDLTSCAEACLVDKTSASCVPYQLSDAYYDGMNGHDVVRKNVPQTFRHALPHSRLQIQRCRDLLHSHTEIVHLLLDAIVPIKRFPVINVIDDLCCQQCISDPCYRY